MDLFDRDETTGPGETPPPPGALPPLAARLRPARLEEIVGQDHLLGEGKPLRRVIEADRISSLILYGPPGCGKTTLAEVVARVTRCRFERASGVLSNVASLRAQLESAAAGRQRTGRRTILFLDEIHRFNKAQQDVLLPYVENGSVTLIGATTHNPFFFINSPLCSRSQIFELRAIGEQEVFGLLRRALSHPDGLGPLRVEADEEALRHLARVCDGDARRALNALEIAARTVPRDPSGVVRIDRAAAEETTQMKAVVYDRDEDGHYDTISAFIKSVRGSDPHAAVYWLAKMILAGEDPRFIARRLIILASEDIGNADPRGLGLAVSALHAAEFLGLPEARIVLSQATTYLATAPKSNAAYLAIEEAMRDIRAGRTLPVPLPLRGTGYRGARELGHTGYRYAHEGEGHFVDQEYAPTSAVYYRPGDQGEEEAIRRRMRAWEARRAKPREGG